jgi:hypothetical protein
VTPEQRIAELELQLASERARADRLARCWRALQYRAAYWRRTDISQSFLAGRVGAWTEIERTCLDALAWARGDLDAGPDGLES